MELASSSRVRGSWGSILRAAQAQYWSREEDQSHLGRHRRDALYLLTFASVAPHRVFSGFSSESKMSSPVDVCVRPSANPSSSVATCVGVRCSSNPSSVLPCQRPSCSWLLCSLRVACGAPLVLRMGCPLIPGGVSSGILLAPSDLKALWMWCMCHVRPLQPCCAVFIGRPSCSEQCVVAPLRLCDAPVRLPIVLG